MKIATEMDVSTIAFRPLPARERKLEVDWRPDGSVVLFNPTPFDDDGRTIPQMFRHWSETLPDRPMLARRGPDRAWQTLTYRNARLQADAIGETLLQTGFSKGDIALILSPSSFEFASFLLGVMSIGGIAAPVSPAYSLLSTDHGKLKSIFERTRPRAIFVQDAGAFEKALAAIDLRDVLVIAVDNVKRENIMTFAEAISTAASDRVEAAFSTVTPDDVAKILFTSGSTGWPKGVINTHRMMSINLAQGAAMIKAEPLDVPTMLSWLPWHHTAGGNGMFNTNIRDGGTYYIDDGKPIPGQFNETIANLREIRLTSYGDMPAAFAMLADAMETDDDLRDTFFSSLAFLVYSGASLPRELLERYYRLSIAATGQRVAFLTGYGATETSPGVAMLTWAREDTGNIGLPYPGLHVKLVPLPDGRFDVRVKGPNVTPGYYNEPQTTAAAFDEEDFYRMGDAVRLVEDGNPLEGMRFAGRVTEDFKLMTGTFVNATALRADVAGALMPLVRDVVVTGHDRPYLGILAWPAFDACRAFLQDTAATEETIINSDIIRSTIRKRIAAYNRENDVSSRRVERVVLLEEPPSIDANEMTDKGYVNQRISLERRNTDVEMLYAGGTGVISIRD